MRLLLLFCIVGMHMTNGVSAIKAVLFDCDGTLIDSEYAHYRAWRQTLVDFGSDLSEEEYVQYVGKSVESNAKLMAQKTGKDCANEILKTKRKYYEKICEEGLPPIDGTVSFLKKLASLDIPVGVCSALRREEIIIHLKHLGIENIVSIVMSGVEDLSDYDDPTGVNKPKPYIYLEAMKRLNILPEETVVIEDSLTGVLAGVRAGCFTIAVPNSYTKDHDLSPADLKLDSLADMDVSNFWKQISLIKQAKGKP